MVMLSFLSDNVKYRFQTRFVDCCTCCVVVVKVNVFHAAVWGSNTGDVYFILLSQSFFFEFFSL